MGLFSINNLYYIFSNLKYNLEWGGVSLKSKKDMPDFKQLEDRVIANPSPEPMLVIKTNLDPKDVTEENPYLKNKPIDEEEFREYFDE